MSRFAVIWIVCLLVAPLSAQPLSAQPPETAAPPPGDDAAAPAAEATASSSAGEQAVEPSEDQSQRGERLAEYLSDVTFVGRFTVDGQPEADPKEESYRIARCEKLPAENMYRLTARIEYGEVNSEVPLDLKILWAGSTPVITLDALWIPGMGTFSARVLIHRDRYSGTWQHGEHGGHLFGKIVPNDQPDPSE